MKYQVIFRGKKNDTELPPNSLDWLLAPLVEQGTTSLAYLQQAFQIALQEPRTFSVNWGLSPPHTLHIEAMHI